MLKCTCCAHLRSHLLLCAAISQELNAQAQAWSPSGRWLATGGEDRVIRIWSYPELELRAVCSGNRLSLDTTSEQHKQGLLSLHVNHDGTRLISCAGDGSIKLWSTARVEGVEEEEGEEEQSSSKSSSTVLTCPLVQNLTMPLVKGSILKFQVARFYGRERKGALGEEEEEEDRDRASKGSKKGKKKRSSEKKDDASDASSASESESESEPEVDEPFSSPSAGGEEHIVAIASQLKRGAGASYLLQYSLHGGEWVLTKQVLIGQSSLTTMETSDDVAEPLVALANTDGLVAIYATRNWKCIKRVAKVHESVERSTAHRSAATRQFLKLCSSRSVLLCLCSQSPGDRARLQSLSPLPRRLLSLAALRQCGQIRRAHRDRCEDSSRGRRRSGNQAAPARAGHRGDPAGGTIRTGWTGNGDEEVVATLSSESRIRAYTIRCI